MTAEEEEIDQAVFQRRPALLDRLRGKDRIDAMDQAAAGRGRRSTPPPAPKRNTRPKSRAPEAQPAGNHPMVDHGQRRSK